MCITSEICGASSSAATRGMRSLPKVVEGANTCVNAWRNLGHLRRERGGQLVFIGGVRHLEHARDTGESARPARPPAIPAR